MKMSNADELETAAHRRIAAQWVAFGGQLSDIDERTPVDIEALLAVTASHLVKDPRIVDVGVDWSVAHGQAVNGSRLRRVATEIGVPDDDLARFGGLVRAAGGPRWPFASSGLHAQNRGRVQVTTLETQARLMWRLRAGFGVSVRTDILYALLTLPASPVTLADIAGRIRSPKRMVARATAAMRLAGLVEVTRVGNQDRVRIPDPSWLRDALEPDGAPAVDWVSRWAIVHRISEVVSRTADTRDSVRAIETRVAAEDVADLCRAAALPSPELGSYGPLWRDEFDRWVGAITVKLGHMGA
jgi:hypothetical protein